MENVPRKGPVRSVCVGGERSTILGKRPKGQNSYDFTKHRHNQDVVGPTGTFRLDPDRVFVVGRVFDPQIL